VNALKEIMRGCLVRGQKWDQINEFCNSLPGFSEAEILAAEQSLKEELEVPFVGNPPGGVTALEVRRNNYRWYTGPNANSYFWNTLATRLRAEGRNDDEIHNIDRESTRILARTPAPHQSQYSGRGLVLGYVQSGKTTNLMSVIAKAADEGYRLIVVLSGVTNNLRNQTQDRLSETLAPSNEQRWYWLTGDNRDFTTSQNAYNLLGNRETVSIAVIKKNAGRLKRLIDWLESAPPGVRMNSSILIIDDECDQASVNTAKANARRTQVNNRLLRLLDGDLMCRNAYIGYSATPFANLLIDPNEDQGLFPRDFIEPISHGKGYFGAEEMFGREALSEEELDLQSTNGVDIIRSIPDSDPQLLGKAFDVRSASAAVLTPSCKEAIDWFLLASATRACRETSPKFSSMLIHSSGRVEAHFAMQTIVNEYVNAIRESFSHSQAKFKQLWEREINVVSEFCEVDADFDKWEKVCAELERILGDVQIVVDNSKSTDRLDYSRQRLLSGAKIVPAIVIGGNTLSRGLTLEGLVSTYFLRTASAYDSLLQMGRWFGYRPLYADLQRIWMTDDMAIWFHDLATVEEEIRQQIAQYAEDEVTPRELPVLIRQHPNMAVTSAAKMANAIQAKTGFSKTRNETLLFKVDDSEMLTRNLDAGKKLVNSIFENGLSFNRGGHIGEACPLALDVPVELIMNFLDDYYIDERSRRLNSKQIINYINLCLESNELSKWNVYLFDYQSQSTQHTNFEFREGLNVARIVRSRLRSESDVANIHHLTSLSDVVIDMPKSFESKVSELSKAKAPLSKWFNLRSDSAYSKNGLLGLYVIDKDSSPLARHTKRAQLAASEHVLGIAFYFPKSDIQGAGLDYVGPNPYMIDLQEDLDDMEAEIDAADAIDDSMVAN